MENNNGKGIFYGVIGIATLIVAIVGATFAYFTATAQSDEGAINVSSYSGFNVSLVMSKIAPSGAVNKLIPLDSGLYMSNALSHTNASGEAEPCIDVNGDQVCAMYQMTLTNSGPAADIQGFLSAEKNEYTGYTPSNLKYQLYTYGDNNSDGVSEYTAISSPVVAPLEGATELPKFVFGTDNDQTANIDESTTISLPAGDQESQSVTLYLVIWLEEYKVEGVSAPQNDDVGKTFTGKVTFNATSGTGEKLEATFG